MIQSKASFVRLLICRKMALDAVPDGGGFADGMDFLSNRERLSKAERDATQWVFSAIDIVRTSGGPNEWADADDESIAAEILSRIERRKA